MKLLYLFAIIASITVKFNNCESNGYYTIIGQNETIYYPPYVCPYGTISREVVGGIDYILSQRRDDFGWREQTHRAIISLALNDFGRSDEDEIRLMKRQLDVELSQALLRDKTMYLNDLALYISALVSVSRNPRDFHGIDLVAILEKQAAKKPDFHPYIVLALCNARSVTDGHLHRIQKYLKEENHKDREFLEMKALSVKAYFCATEEIEVKSIHRNDVEKSLACLLKQYGSDGSFGNLFTTSLAMQALISARKVTDWDVDSTVAYLTSHRTIDVSIISTYYIEMALRSMDIPFLKALSSNQVKTYTELERLLSLPVDDFVRYSIEVGEYPDTMLTLTFRVPPKISFYDVMLIAAHKNDGFRFSSFTNKDGYPEVYSISGIPNNAEESLYWHLYKKNRTENVEVYVTPSQLIPNKDDHMIYCYKESFKALRDESLG